MNNDAISKDLTLRALESAKSYVTKQAEEKDADPTVAAMVCEVVDIVLNFIGSLPALDAVPVVRCGECRWNSTCKAVGEYKGKNGYCSLGAREEQDNEQD